MRIPKIALYVVDRGSVGGRAPTARHMGAASALAIAFIVGLPSACTKKDDGPRPAAIAPNPGAPAAAPAAPSAPMAAPMGVPAAPPPAPADDSPASRISGKITLAPERKADVTPNDVVYLVARRLSDNPNARGSLVAVKRLSASSFPIEFTLGAGDMMFKNGAFEGELTLAARVDKDGDPMTRRKGDVFGTIARVKVGSSAVEVKLDQLQKEDESLAGGAPPMQGTLPPGHP